MATRGPGIGTVVFVVLLVLKLAHIVDWPWWWITAPLWLCAAAAIFGAVLAVVITLIEESRHAH